MSRYEGQENYERTIYLTPLVEREEWVATDADDPCGAIGSSPQSALYNLVFHGGRPLCFVTMAQVMDDHPLRITLDVIQDLDDEHPKPGAWPCMGFIHYKGDVQEVHLGQDFETLILGVIDETTPMEYGLRYSLDLKTFVSSVSQEPIWEDPFKK